MDRLNMETPIRKTIREVATAKETKARDAYFKAIRDGADEETIIELAAVAGIGVDTIEADLAFLEEAAALAPKAGNLIQLRKAVALARGKVEAAKVELKTGTERLTQAVKDAEKNLRQAEDPAGEAYRAAEKLEGMYRNRPELLPPGTAPKIVALIVERNELDATANAAAQAYERAFNKRITFRDGLSKLAAEARRFDGLPENDPQAKPARDALAAAQRELRELEDAETQAKAEAAKTKAAAENAKYRTA
jgi:hypothetical protein